jgi:hypothetical protein
MIAREPARMDPHHLAVGRFGRQLEQQALPVVASPHARGVQLLHHFQRLFHLGQRRGFPEALRGLGEGNAEVALLVNPGDQEGRQSQLRRRGIKKG